MNPFVPWHMYFLAAQAIFAQQMEAANTAYLREIEQEKLVAEEMAKLEAWLQELEGRS